MKRLLTGILIIALTLSLGVTAYAATPATVAAAETQAHPGDTVNVAVTVADNPGMDVMKLKFSYDATALVLKDMLPGDVMTGAFTPNPEKAVVLLEAADKENESGNGEFRAGAGIHKPQWRKMADALCRRTQGAIYFQCVLRPDRRSGIDSPIFYVSGYHQGTNRRKPGMELLFKQRTFNRNALGSALLIPLYIHHGISLCNF